jgi:hypothetical protein
MSDHDIERIISLLEEIRDGQKLQLARQAEALQRQAELLDTQRSRLASFAKQSSQVDAFQERADQVVTKAAGLVGGARLAILVVVPFAVLLLIFVCWLVFGRAGP